MIDSQLALRANIPVLTPRNNPHLVQQFLLRHIPEANPTGTNTLSNNDTLSPLIYALVTTPFSSHSWIVFKFMQEQELRVAANVNADAVDSACLNLFNFPPFSQFAVDTSRAVAQFWTSLNEMEVAEWEELARDISEMHTRLVALFGNGVVFDWNAWEAQRQYHARTIYLKWTGSQAIHGVSRADDESTTYYTEN
ncbi:10912_t:CDS:2 [Acaulospora colombiana]|uniref:10912_t:CDS:1 n=1 Tax=Acaulospora colombiana TaxID=27376 RepID=A0ACA9MG98_9GLOM|nr:10912_t:CDS:2 [Acaulospora colombiana]